MNDPSYHEHVLYHGATSRSVKDKILAFARTCAHRGSIQGKITLLYLINYIPTTSCYRTHSQLHPYYQLL